MALTKVSTPAIKDEAITLAKLLHGDSNNNGKFLRANNGADPTFETIDLTALSASNLTSGTIPDARFPATLPAINGANLTGINTDLVSDTSPQLGGHLDAQGFDINLDTSSSIYWGNSNEARAFYHGSHFQLIYTGSGSLQNKIKANSYFQIVNNDTGDNMLQAQAGGALSLWHAGSQKLLTQSGGVRVYGDLENHNNNFVAKDNCKFTAGNSEDLQIYHDGNHSYIKDNGTGNLRIQSNATIQLGDPTGGIDYAKFINGGYSEIYGDNNKRFETTSYGTKVTGYQSASSYVGFHVMGSNQDHGYGTNHGSGITTYDVSYYSPIPMWSSKTIDHGSSYLSFPSYAGGNYIKFTAPVAGLYQLELIASVESHHGGDWCQIGWEINTTSNDNSTNFMNNNRGVMAVNQRAGDDTEMGCHFSTTIYLAANDYAVLYQQSTAAVRWRGNQYYVRGHLL